MKRHGVLGALLLCLAAAAVSLACGKSSPEKAGSSAEGAPTAAAPAPSSTGSAAESAVANPSATLESAEAVDLEVGKALKPDGHVTESATLFKPTDTVHVVLVTKGTVSGVKIQAVVSFQNGTTLFDSSRVVDLKGPGTTTAFEATSKSGWPAGKCQLRILIAGRSYRTWDFSVK